MVERGLTSILRDALGAHRVRKGHFQLASSRVTFNPDLVFDAGRAVGDVKYKLSAGDWDRSDLYQAIAFAEAYRAERALIVRFRGPSTGPAPDLLVGGKAIHEVTWRSDAAVSASDAGIEVAEAVATWLGPEAVPLSA